jgi:hypothetical protein
MASPDASRCRPDSRPSACVRSGSTPSPPKTSGLPRSAPSAHLAHTSCNAHGAETACRVPCPWRAGRTSENRPDCTSAADIWSSGGGTCANRPSEGCTCGGRWNMRQWSEGCTGNSHAWNGWSRRGATPIPQHRSSSTRVPKLTFVKSDYWLHSKKIDDDKMQTTDRCSPVKFVTAFLDTEKSNSMCVCYVHRCVTVTCNVTVTYIRLTGQ